MDPKDKLNPRPEAEMDDESQRDGLEPRKYKQD